METLNATNVFTYENYFAIISKRENLGRYPSHPYSMIVKKSTPKAKYFSEKTICNFVYRTIEEATAAAERHINGYKQIGERKAAEKQKRAEENAAVKAADFYKVGDIIVNSWGWEQTNVEFYKVVKVGNKTINIIQVCGKMEENSGYSHGMACNMLPTDTIKENGDKYTLRVKAAGRLSNPETFYYMHKWDGKPNYCSWYA